MLSQIVTAFARTTAVVLPIWLAMRLAIYVFSKSPRVAPNLRHESLLVLVILYAVAVAALTIIPVPMSRARDPQAVAINMVPFATLSPCITALTRTLSHISSYCVQNIGGNIVLLIPLALLLRSIQARRRHAFQVVLLAVIVSLGIEVTQYVERSFGNYRSVDVDDVVLNVLGAYLGWLPVAAYARWRARGTLSTAG